MSRMRGRSVSPGEAFQNNLGAGVAIGAGAYVVNYVLMYLFVTIDGADTGDEGWKVVGNLLYNAQFVDSEISVAGRSQSINYLSEAGQASKLTSTVPEIVYSLAPILVLVVAGFLVAQQANGRLDTGSGAATGATIVGGYLVLSAVGVFLFEISQQGLGGTTTLGPKLMTGILLAGLALPAVLGAIGGAVSAET